MHRGGVAAATLTLVIVLSSVPAGAHPVAGHIEDIEADANLLNTQGFGGLVGPNPLDPGVGTGAASYAPADIRAVRFATDFIAVPVGDDGIDYQATGVRIMILTETAPRSDGPTLIYRLNVNVGGGCNSFFNGFMRGVSSLPGDPAHLQLEWRQLDAGCPDGVVTRVMPPATVNAALNAIVFTLPYGQLTAAQAATLAEGEALVSPQANTRTNFTWGSQGVLPYSGVTAPQIDETVIGEEWIVGSDMPDDVPCTLNCP